LSALAAEPRSAHLKALTGLRFYAALLVVVHHVTHNLAPIPVVRDIFLVGGVGVSFFFVLSGFVLMWTRSPDVSNWAFYRNRFARVFPLHGLTWAIAGAFIFLTAGKMDPAVAVATLILLQSWIPAESFYFGMNGPSWSLSCEAFFYAAFPWLARRIGQMNVRQVVRLMIGLLVVAGVISVVGHLLLRDGPSVGLLYVNPLYRVWEFLSGMLLALMVKRGWRTAIKPQIAAAATGGAFLAVAGTNYLLERRVGVFAKLPIHGLPSDVASIFLAPCFAVLIATVACAELRGERLHLQSKLLVRLGEWSFALYLSHLLIVEALRLVVPEGLDWAGSTLVAAMTISGAIAVSGVLYCFVEKPLQEKIRSSKQGRVANLARV
jgi:peptidoglycan/LPS O-acetylase OafA/YrhL